MPQNRKPRQRANTPSGLPLGRRVVSSGQKRQAPGQRTETIVTTERNYNLRGSRRRGRILAEGVSRNLRPETPNRSSKRARRPGGHGAGRAVR